MHQRRCDRGQLVMAAVAVASRRGGDSQWPGDGQDESDGEAKAAGEQGGADRDCAGDCPAEDGAEWLAAPGDHAGDDVDPALHVVPLSPVVAQWDRLSRTWCYMLILTGPAKVNLIFGQPHAALPPWQPSASTLRGIDDHFWDWTLWLQSKQLAGKHGLVEAELGKLHDHLLGPLGVIQAPGTIELAIVGYRTARNQWERRLGIRIPRAAEEAVMQAAW